MNLRLLIPVLFVAAFASGQSQTYYFSHFAFSGGYQTTLTYVNYSPQTVTCVTNFYSDQGLQLLVPFGIGTTATRSDVLQAGQSIHDETIAPLAPPFVTGWVQATCNAPVQASLLYRYYQNGVPSGEASVSAELTPATQFVTFAQTVTGMAFANPSTTQSASITVSAYNTSGVKLGTTTIGLAPLSHSSANLSPLLSLTSPFTGFVKVTSTIPILSFSLNFEAFPTFSSLPAGDLPASVTLVP